MTPKRFISLLRRADPALFLSFSERSRQWIVQKKLPKCVYQSPEPGTLPASGVWILREVRHLPVTMCALPYGLTDRSLTALRRNMFWHRGVSADTVANAMDRDDALHRKALENDRKRYRESFQEDHGRQITKKLKGEPTIQAGINLCQSPKEMLTSN